MKRFFCAISAAEKIIFHDIWLAFDSYIRSLFKLEKSRRIQLQKNFRQTRPEFFFHFDQIKKLDVDTHKESQAFDVSSWIAFLLLLLISCEWKFFEKWSSDHEKKKEIEKSLIEA